MWTFDKALSDDLVTVLSRDDSRGTFEVRVGELKTIVTIDLGRFMNSERTKYRTSHAIKTPNQSSAYWTSLPEADYPAAALHKALEGLTSYYREAIRDKLQPNEKWLIPA